LKEADIGIAMGQRGTDVAREAADLVLLDDDFASIVSSIRMGRRIYGNLQSAISYLLAVHIPIAGISVIPVFFEMPPVLAPIHVALLHLIIEPACSVAFEAEPAQASVMSIPPRRPEERLFSRQMMLPTLVRGFSVLAALLFVFFMGIGKTGPKLAGESLASTLTFLTLMAANMGLIASHRISHLRQKKHRSDKSNPAFFGVLALSTGLIALGLLIPSVRRLLHFTELSTHEACISIILGLLSSLLPSIFFLGRLKVKADEARKTS
jgi:Ca2+-transporting ATPase